MSKVSLADLNKLASDTEEGLNKLSERMKRNLSVSSGRFDEFNIIKNAIETVNKQQNPNPFDIEGLYQRLQGFRKSCNKDIKFYKLEKNHPVVHTAASSAMVSLDYDTNDVLKLFDLENNKLFTRIDEKLGKKGEDTGTRISDIMVNMKHSNERIIEHKWTEKTLDDQTILLNDTLKTEYATFTALTLAASMLSDIAYLDDNDFMKFILRYCVDRFKGTTFYKHALFMLRVETFEELFGYIGIDILRLCRINGKYRTTWPWIDGSNEDTIDDEDLATTIVDRLSDFDINKNVINKLTMLGIDQYKGVSIPQAIAIITLKEYIIYRMDLKGTELYTEYLSHYEALDNLGDRLFGDENIRDLIENSGDRNDIRDAWDMLDWEDE